MLFSGCGVALVTPFTKGEVDYLALGGLIDWQAESGTDALIALGTTGEPCVLTDKEMDEVLEFCVARAGDRMPVIAGCGTNDTARTARRAKRCGQLGAEALLAVTPYYLRTSQEGLYGHYMRVADACEKPLILYNVPTRTGVNLLPETAARLTAHPMIQGVKEASGDIAQFGELARLPRGRLSLYSGNDDMAVAAMALGARGVISVAANVAPERMREMACLALEGDFEGARAIHFELGRLFKMLFAEPNPIPVKAALAMMGRIDEELRPPLCPLSPKYRGELREVLGL